LTSMTGLWKNRPSKSQRHQDPDGAIAGYLERLRLADLAGTPAPPSILNGLGDAYLDKEQIDAAIDYYRQAAEAYGAAGLHDNAIACCRKIRRHAPYDPNVALLLARFYAMKGLRADALAELEALADRGPDLRDRGAALEALRQIVRLEPGRADRREQLARLLHHQGERDAAIAEYRAALSAYEAGNDARGAERVREPLAELERRRPAAGVAGPASVEPTAPRPAIPRGAVEGAARPLEIEHTSYLDQETARSSSAAPTGAARTPSADGDDGLSSRERLALAEAYLDAGREEEAARTLALAAESFRRERHWAEAVDAYRRLSGTGRAAAEQYAAWAECARQSGEPSKVLEALSATSRWYLQKEDQLGARRSAEEMLLIDPLNATASEILERVGPARPLE
jgi:tetratricopeptide (TPR) repeat protein